MWRNISKCFLNRNKKEIKKHFPFLKVQLSKLKLAIPTKRKMETLETFLNQINTHPHTYLPKSSVLCFRQVQSRHSAILQPHTYLPKVWFCAFVKSKAGIPQFCNHNAYKKRRKRNVSTLKTFLNKHIALYTDLRTYL